MSDISKINVNGTLYDFKDSVARDELSSLNAAFINVVSEGLVGDGETDNTDAFNELYENHPYETLYFPEGTYCFSSQLTVGLAHIFLDRATLKWTETCEYGIYMTGYLPDEAEIGDDDFSASMNIINGHKPTYGNYITGRGGTIDCNYKATNGIYIGTQRMTDISNLTIHNFAGYGINQPTLSYTNSDGETGYFSFELNCHNLLFDNDYDDTNNDCLNSVGIYMQGDGTIRDVVMVNAHTGIISGGANTISNVHAWLYDFKTTKDYEIISDSVFYQGANDVISDCYIDTYLIGLYLTGNNTRITNLGWYINWNTWSSSFTPAVIKVSNSPTFALFGARIAANANELFIYGTPGNYIATGLMITGSGCSDAVDTIETLLNNVPTPTNDTDAANKAYVDDKLSTTRKIKATLEDGSEVILEVPIISEEVTTGISLSATSGTLAVTGTVTLTATLNNIEGDITWSSSDESIATVSDGVVTAIAEGSCTITATCGEYSAEYALTVSSSTVSCTSLTSRNFDSDLGVTLSSSQTSRTLTFKVSPSTTTDTFSITSSDESIVTIGETTYSSGIATVVINVVGEGSTKLTAVCGSQSLIFTVNVTNGLSALSSTSFDISSDELIANLDLSTCGNSQECVFYMGSEAGASGWDDGSSVADSCLYVYYYPSSYKLELDCCSWGSANNSSSRSTTLSSDQISDITITINSTALTVTSGDTTVYTYSYDSSVNFWANIQSTVYVGYGQDNCASNATYNDGWLTVNGETISV